jgi:hypothetical protein
MPGNGTIINHSGPLADQQLIGHKAPVPLRCSVPGGSERPACPQTSSQVAAQRSAALDIERLIDRLVRHAHRLIIGEVHAETPGDLLRAPALPPPTVLARSLTPPTPRDIRTRDTPVRPLHRPRKPILHISAQHRVDLELGRLGSTGATLRMPVRGRGSILNSTASDRRVALQLPRDRRRRTTQPRRHPLTPQPSASRTVISSRSVKDR